MRNEKRVENCIDVKIFCTICSNINIINLTWISDSSFPNNVPFMQNLDPIVPPMSSSNSTVYALYTSPTVDIMDSSFRHTPLLAYHTHTQICIIPVFECISYSVKAFDVMTVAFSWSEYINVKIVIHKPKIYKNIFIFCCCSISPLTIYYFPFMFSFFFNFFSFFFIKLFKFVYESFSVSVASRRLMLCYLEARVRWLTEWLTD